MERIWNQLNQRLSWPIVNRVLNQKALPTKQGKEKTFEALQLEYESSSEARATIDSLTDNLEKSILYCNKYLRFFTFPEQSIQAALDRIDTDFHTLNPGMGRQFPLSDDEDIIDTADINRPELIKITRDSGRTYLIFSTIRQVRSTENLSDRFGDVNGAEFISDFTKVYGERVVSEQFFDIICIDPQRNVIEFRIDNYTDSTYRFLEAAYHQIQNAANVIFSGLSNVHFIGRSHNFQPMLRPLYEDGQQGKVKEMAFLTDSDSLKHEKMNYINTVDLRLEPYHDAGKAGISGMDFYRLGLSWDVSEPFKNTIGMAVLGRHHMLRLQGGAYINDAYIRDCHSPQEYYFLVDLIDRYTSQN